MCLPLPSPLFPECIDDEEFVEGGSAVALRLGEGGVEDGVTEEEGKGEAKEGDESTERVGGEDGKRGTEGGVSRLGIESAEGKSMSEDVPREASPSVRCCCTCACTMYVQLDQTSFRFPSRVYPVQASPTPSPSMLVKFVRWLERGVDHNVFPSSTSMFGCYAVVRFNDKFVCICCEQPSSPALSCTGTLCGTSSSTFALFSSPLTQR